MRIRTLSMVKASASPPVRSVGTPISGGMDVDLETPFLYQYNLTWEQRVGRDSTVEVSYVGSQGRDLLRIW